MKTSNSWQHESPAYVLGPAGTGRNSAGRSPSVEIRQDDRDELPSRWAPGSSTPYEMPALGWRYG